MCHWGAAASTGSTRQTRGCSHSVAPELLPAGAKFYLPNPEANRELRKQTRLGKLAHCARKASVSNSNKWKDFTQLLAREFRKKKKLEAVCIQHSWWFTIKPAWEATALSGHIHTHTWYMVYNNSTDRSECSERGSRKKPL